MSPEARAALARARQRVANARAIAGIGIFEVAAREAYLVVLGAAQALLFERTGRIVKTHSGVRTQVALLARDDPALDPTLAVFLARACDFKEVADYGGTRRGPITAEEAEWAVTTAQQLLHHVAVLLGDTTPT